MMSVNIKATMKGFVLVLNTIRLNGNLVVVLILKLFPFTQGMFETLVILV